MRNVIALITALMIANTLLADDVEPPSTGLSVFVNANGYFADSKAASFYDGSPSRLNTIDRILHSNTYGLQIWQRLTTAGLISDAVSNYTMLQVAEYAPQMHYHLSYQVGLGVRYDYASGFGWLLGFNLAQLRAEGAFNLSANNGTGLLGSGQYVTCGIGGSENRINIDAAITKTLPLSPNISLELELGGSLINTKVKDNIIEIAGSTFSILDRWNGNAPDDGTGEYEYINQGRIGYGVFASILVGYQVPNLGAIKAGYTCSQARISFEDGQYWGWQHTVGIRVELNNFSLL